MPRGGLSREKVVAAAASWIEQFGTRDFSMRALAESLNVKPASLYNHVSGMDALMAEVCAYALRMQRDWELAAIRGITGTAAIAALAEAYRQFAREHRQLYRLIMTTAAACGEELGESSRCLVEPFMQVLEHTALSQEEKIHWQRVLRGIVHGFVSQEDAGFFSHLPAAVDDSFHTAIVCYIDGLNQAQRRNAE